MKTNWKAMAASLAVLIGVSGAAWGQDWDHRKDNDDRAKVEHRDRDHDRDNRGWNNGYYRNNGAYRDRDHDGDHDRDDRRVYNNGWYGNRPVYNGGYYGGYSPYYGGNNGYYGNGYYGNSRYYANNASRIGYQDGINDGRSDRMTGHSFRPTHDDNFKNADRGYSSAFGDKQMYKNTYRQGYEQGYQQGYGR